LAIFLPALVMGNFMVLNLFLALLLNSFNCEELKSRKEVGTILKRDKLIRAWNTSFVKITALNSRHYEELIKTH
jgi:NADPH-dependent 7-cyano-7-deazaguanine reductase QueF-like protein